MQWEASKWFRQREDQQIFIDQVIMANKHFFFCSGAIAIFLLLRDDQILFEKHFY
jgi:hypothetical protein